MKIAIHHREMSFSRIWIKYCEDNNIPFKIVNCYDSDIISQLEDCRGLMWHWDLNDYKAELFVRQLTYSLEKKGIKVFPDIKTCWHYEDKVGQKYLLEAANAPLIESFVFYTKQDALKWNNNTSFPKVFKLRTGSASSNVILVNNKQKGEKLINRSFGKGFRRISKFRRLKSRLYLLRLDKNFKALKSFFGGIGRFFIPTEVEKYSNLEKGYIYFQDFAANNEFDIRLVVIGDKCFGMIRYVRKGDFRASGSGLKDYNHSLIGKECVSIAFKTAQKLKSQSTAFDLIKYNGGFKIIEISYAFVSETFPGYWDMDLIWHEGEICPQETMIDNFIKSF
jgi:hypothetical protein